MANDDSVRKEGKCHRHAYGPSAVSLTMNAIRQDDFFFEAQPLGTTTDQTSIANIVAEPFILKGCVIKIDQSIIVGRKHNKTPEYPVVQFQHATGTQHKSAIVC